MNHDIVERLRCFGYGTTNPEVCKEAADTIESLRARVAELERPDFRQMREMLRAMQAGELTVSRGIEILDMRHAGNWNDDMLPLDDRYTDWQKWLGFARAAYEAGATDEREACANVCDANAKHWREMYTTANPRAAELVLRGYSAREDSAADCATNIRERSNA